MGKHKILIAEDEPNLREVLRFQLENQGYDVVEAKDGLEALSLAAGELPDLILLDVMMPQLDGYEACRRLRAAFATRHIPIILLTAKTEDEDKVIGLQGGANDYVTKPYKTRELMVRIHNCLEWSRQQRAANPLTGLPGNLSIDEEVRRRLERGGPFAMLLADIDHFKSFNDYYGYPRGDQAIQRLARLMITTAEQHGGDGAFVGHIGGDDFIILCEPEHAEAFGETLIEEFERASVELYDPIDRERGHVEVRNRLHRLERFPLMSLTLALVSTELVPISHFAQLTDIAQELKQHGKGIPGSVLVGERRRTGSDPGSESGAQAA